MNQPTKEQIFESFLRLYQSNPYEKITVKLICSESHVSRTTFYSYFDSVHAVLNEIEDRLISDVFAINEKFQWMNFRDWKKGDPFPFFAETVAYIREHFLAFQTLLSRGDPRFIFLWKKIIRHHFREKYVTEGIAHKNQELILEMTASSLIGMYTYWVTHPNEVDEAELLDVALPRVVFDLTK